MKRIFNILIASLLSASLLSAGTPAALLAHYCGSELMDVGAADDAAVLSGCCSAPTEDSHNDHKDADCTGSDCCSFETVVFPGTDETTRSSSTEFSPLIAIAPAARINTRLIARNITRLLSYSDRVFATPWRGGWIWRIAIQSFQL